jgi:hypothetical protein
MAPDDAPLEFDFLHLPASQRGELDDWRARGGLVLDMQRRGIDHGALVVGDLPPPPTPDPAAAWRTGRPAFLPDLLTDRVAAHATEVADTLAMFDRLRDGGRFLDEVDTRIGEHELFRYAGSTLDQGDDREIEKLFVDVQRVAGERRLARDLSIKLAWIARDESDPSLRIRISFGHEATRDWLADDPRHDWSDRLADAVFDEFAIALEAEGLHEILRRATDADYRLSERIVYNNAPGGGATFHQDADPGQRGVVFVQLSGVTVWLAVPVVELAEQVTAHGHGNREDVLAALTTGEPADGALWRTLNADPSFTARLFAAGHGYALGTRRRDAAPVARPGGLRLARGVRQRRGTEPRTQPRGVRPVASLSCPIPAPAAPAGRWPHRHRSGVRIRHRGPVNRPPARARSA